MAEDKVKLCNCELRHIRKVLDLIQSKSSLNDIELKLDKVWKDLRNVSKDIDRIYIEDWWTHINPGGG